MMRSHTYAFSPIIIISLFLATVSASGSAAPLSFRYKYNLADFSGTVPYMQAILAKDNVRNEIYVMHPTKKNIRIFGDTGMEIYQFGDEGEFAWAKDLAVDDAGHIYFLNSFTKQRADRITITRCNFRGTPEAEFFIQGIPKKFSGLTPAYMEIVKEKIYLADPLRLSIIVTDINGNFEKGYDLQKMIDEIEEAYIAKKKKQGIQVSQRTMTRDITGFSVDSHGNMYFTVASIFAAFRLSPSGELESFGKSGGGPGSFGVASGIAADDMGYIYVTDKLRCVVIVFNKNFDFVTEFGFRGYRARNLIVPSEIVVARDGRLYVAQAANRGVSVFTVVSDRQSDQ